MSHCISVSGFIGRPSLTALPWRCLQPVVDLHDTAPSFCHLPDVDLGCSDDLGETLSITEVVMQECYGLRLGEVVEDVDRVDVGQRAVGARWIDLLLSLLYIVGLPCLYTLRAARLKGALCVERWY